MRSGIRDRVGHSCARWGELSDRQRAAVLAALIRWHSRHGLLTRLAELVAAARDECLVMSATAMADRLAVSRRSAARRRFEETLLATAKTGPPRRRCAAIEALSSVSNREHAKIDVLMAALLDDDDRVRDAAWAEFSPLGRAALPRLLAALVDRAYAKRGRLWYVLMAVDYVASSVPLDESMLRDLVTTLRSVAVSYRGPDASEVRWKAIESLGPLHIGGKVGIETLEVIAQQTRGYVRSWALAQAAGIRNALEATNHEAEDGPQDRPRRKNSYARETAPDPGETSAHRRNRQSG